MLNKIFAAVLCFLVLASLWGCEAGDVESEPSADIEAADTQSSHSHDFLPATCFNPKTCSCGATEGEALGHRYTEATYDAPKTCQHCGKTVGDKLKLSESCQQVLASGRYGENFYEIVSNQYEDYTGLRIEVGVIKNNEWLLEPTVDMPFVTEENMFESNGPETGEVFYLGKGCFLSEKVKSYEYSSSDDYMYIFYNADTGAFYSTANYEWNEKDRIDSLIRSNTDDCLIIGESAVHHRGDDGEYVRTDFITLNKVDMTLGTISVYHDYAEATMCGNIAGGLFAISFGGYANYPEYYFYDLNGNIVIDLSEYKTEWQSLFFSDGECEIDIINNNGTEYTITIDKEGNVLDSVIKSD